ncbi:hypothetical protein PAALTS15_08034 [Paenibacillus alvei TS-15]|uniref:Major facilitator superfamily (MFS) profile domain-containing protein n=1 Tax=Paenibacillus alvei TS-15 TaxID=1117108 RepID=S9SUP7_PAEAL|nr:MFS transporter [Paenibacillus alvei]EPY07878.1 hypothetical protein PAALTS15_08034 [Paenibacillus alvei TS-15]
MKEMKEMKEMKDMNVDYRNNDEILEEKQPLWTKPFVVLAGSNFLVSLNLLMITPALPAYVKDAYQADNMTVSFVVSLFALSAIVTRLFAGRFFDRFQAMSILIAGLLIYALSTGAYAFVPSLALFMLVRMIYGAGFGITSTALGTLATRIIPPRRMGEGMGYYGLSSSLSMAIAPIIGLWLLQSYGYEYLIGTTFVLIIIIFPMLPLLRSAKAPTSQATIRPQGSWIDRRALLPCTLNFLVTITYGGILSFITMFGQERGIANVSLFFLCNAISILVVRTFAGRLYDSKGHFAVVPAGGIMLAASLVVLAYSASTGMLCLAAAMYGLGYGSLQPAFQAWAVQRVPADQHAAATGMFYNSIDLGVALGSLLLGAVASVTTYSNMYLVSSLSAVLLLLIYAFALLRARASRMSGRDEATASAT